MAHARFPTPPFFPRVIRIYGLEECLTIVLTSKIGRRATGVVHRGTLEPEIRDDAMPLDVALVMLYAGVPLSGVTESQGKSSISDWWVSSPRIVQLIVLIVCSKSTLSILESIQLAGILHGDIRRKDILIGDLGELRSSTLGIRNKCDDQGAKDEEFAWLCSFLGLAGESH